MEFNESGIMITILHYFLWLIYMCRLITSEVQCNVTSCIWEWPIPSIMFLSPRVGSRWCAAVDSHVQVHQVFCKKVWRNQVHVWTSLQSATPWVLLKHMVLVFTCAVSAWLLTLAHLLHLQLLSLNLKQRRGWILWGTYGQMENKQPKVFWLNRLVHYMIYPKQEVQYIRESSETWRSYSIATFPHLSHLKRNGLKKIEIFKVLFCFLVHECDP